MTQLPFSLGIPYIPVGIALPRRSYTSASKSGKVLQHNGEFKEITKVHIPCHRGEELCGVICTLRIPMKSVQFSHSAVSDSLWPHGLQHTRPPCPSPAPGVYSDSYPLSWWCHPSIWSCVIPFSSCLQSFPASGSFPRSQFFTSGSQSIGVHSCDPIDCCLPGSCICNIFQARTLGQAVSSFSRWSSRPRDWT